MDYNETPRVYRIDKDRLREIATAIRQKRGKSDDELINVRDFKGEILQIQTGIEPTGTKYIDYNGDGIDVREVEFVDVNVQPDLRSANEEIRPNETLELTPNGFDGFSKVIVSVNQDGWSPTPLLESPEKTVTPSDGTVVIKPSDGYYGLARATVNMDNTGWIEESTLHELGEGTITPDDEQIEITPEDGFNGFKTVTVTMDKTGWMKTPTQDDVLIITENEDYDVTKYGKVMVSVSPDPDNWMERPTDEDRLAITENGEHWALPYRWVDVNVQPRLKQPVTIDITPDRDSPIVIEPLKSNDKYIDEYGLSKVTINVDNTGWMKEPTEIRDYYNVTDSVREIDVKNYAKINIYLGIEYFEANDSTIIVS